MENEITINGKVDVPKGSMRIIRQGDVLLKEIKEMPKGLKNKNRTLAYGEITGHHHTLEQGFVFEDLNKNQFCDLEQDTVLEHQDHAHVTIPKGKYAVVIQREYDIMQGIRQVMD